MNDRLDKLNVLVKENSDNTVTITKDVRPSHNSQRVARQSEIVVSFFTDADLQQLRDVQITPISRVKSGIFTSYWEKYISYIMKKKHIESKLSQNII